MAAGLYGEAVARIVEDPDTAASLTPTHPFGCKRPIIDQGYYETFNRDNVTLVDLRKDPIREVTPTGIRHRAGLLRPRRDHLRHRLRRDDRGADAASTSAGRDGMSLQGLLGRRRPAVVPRARGRGLPEPVHRPGAGKPRAGNAISSPRSNSTWSGSAIASSYLRANGYRTIEALPEAQQRVDRAHHVARRADGARPSVAATPGTTAATCPARNGCTWATPAGSRSTAGGATRSPTPATPASSSRDEDLRTRLADRPGFRGCAAARACRVAELRRLEPVVAERRSPARRGGARRTRAVGYDADGAAAEARALVEILRGRGRRAVGAGCRPRPHATRNHCG